MADSRIQNLTEATSLDATDWLVAEVGDAEARKVTPATVVSAVDPVAQLFGTPTTAFEFGTTSLTGLTALGSATAEAAHSTIAGHYYVQKAATSTPALTGRYATAPSAPFTAITKLTAHNTVAIDFLRVGGLFIGEGTPGAIDAIHILYNATGALTWCVSHVRYSNPTTFSATLGTDRSIKYVQCPLYYMIVVNTATDVDFWWSFDGYVWSKRTDARNPSITIGSVGIVVDPEQATFAATGAYDYLRIWNSALTPLGM